MGVIRQISLSPVYRNLPVLEDFIRSCSGMDDKTRDRATLIATEYFDNIICHSKSLFKGQVLFQIRKNNSYTLFIKYRTCNFSRMLNALDSTAPHFDRLSRRYRGLGLRMCSNLSSRTEYHKGLFTSSITIIL